MDSIFKKFKFRQDLLDYLDSFIACGETRLRVINYLVNPVDPVWYFF
jgi:hypothetical protein